MQLLVTGFGPFEGVPENPSQLLAETSGAPFVVLPVSYEAVDQFVENVDRDSFDTLLMLGVARERPRVCLESLARNVKAGTDVAGASRSGLIDPDRPDTLEATLWRGESKRELLARFPQELAESLDAGSYLCNYLSFRALAAFPTKRVGFLHVVSRQAIRLDRQMEILASVKERIG